LTNKCKHSIINGKLKLSGQDIFYITTGTYYLTGIEISGQTKLYITGTVRIFSTGKIQVSGQSELHYTGNPYNLVIYCNTTEQILISGQGEMKGIIYAPDSEVQISGLGITISNVFGKTVKVSGNGKIVGVNYTTSTVGEMSIMSEQKTSDINTEFKFGKIFVYPNPAKNGQNPVVHIEVGIADNVEIKLFDISGMLIKNDIISGDNYKTTSGRYYYDYIWNTQDIANGIYLCLIKATKHNYPDIKRIIKIAIIH